MTVKIPVRLGRSKYRAVPTVIDNIRFASKREAARYGELKILEKAGLIGNLQLQPKLRLNVNGKPICTYVGDFSYQEHFVGVSRKVLEDVKGVKTPVYRLKKKLVEAIYGIEIREV